MKRNLFGKFDEAGNPKASLTKNSVKFIDFAEPQRPHGRPFFEAVMQTLHFTVIRSVG